MHANNSSGHHYFTDFNVSDKMRLSILIPTFNYVCVQLVQELALQCKQCSLLEEYEIIVADDCSDTETITQNRKINLITNCHYQESDTNLGRSRILNKMTKQMKYEWVLIIDSDAEVCSDTFISTYLSAAKGNDVICGGIKTSAKYSRTDNQLRYRYEENAHSIRSMKYRGSHPYMRFSSFNIMINATVFHSVNFDDSIVQYGYEDTLFGIGLKRCGINITHIDNPLIHTGIDSNLTYLIKTEKALQNLRIIKDKLQEGSILYQTFLRLQRCHLLPLVRIWHMLFANIERKNLLSHHPSLFVFNIYKLGYFTMLNDN